MKIISRTKDITDESFLGVNLYHTDICKYEASVMTYQNRLALAAEIFESAVYVLKQKMKDNFSKNVDELERNLKGLFGPFIMFLVVLFEATVSFLSVRHNPHNEILLSLLFCMDHKCELENQIKYLLYYFYILPKGPLHSEVTWKWHTWVTDLPFFSVEESLCIFYSFTYL